LRDAQAGGNRGAPDEVDRGTMTFLADSVDLAMEAERLGPTEFGNTLSRSSLLSTNLFLEACANTCLDMLAIESHQFASEIDRLPLIAKFELVVKLQFPNRTFNRSRHEVQGAVELKRVRDSFVHPKGQRIIWDSWSPNSSVSRSPRTKALDLPRIATYCHLGDAVVALKAAHAFLRYFFKDVCRFGPRRVGALLTSEDPVPNLKSSDVIYWERAKHQWLRKHHIDLSYMRIGSL
jgi:hypothetical protein